MAEAARHLPLGGAAATGVAPLPPGIVLCPPAARFVLRGDDSVMRAAGAVLGLQPSTVACRAAVGGEWSALWQGPDEQLLIGPDAETERIAAALATALAALPHSLVDVSHRQIGIEISGAQATTLLATGCPLDLDPAAFPVGMATRTVYLKTEIVLWRLAAERFRVEVWRSFAAYLVGQLRLTP